MLYTFDTQTIRSWDVVSGESIFVFATGKQIRGLTKDGDAQITTACWASDDHSCFATGTQAGSIILWNALSGLLTKVWHLPCSGGSAKEVTSLMRHKGALIVAVSTRLFSVPIDQKDGNIVTIDETVSPISACCAVKDCVLAVGTLDGVLKVHHMETEVVRSAMLKKRSGLTKSSTWAVESLKVITRGQHTLLACLLSSGSIVVYSAAVGAVLWSFRVCPKADAALVCSAITPDQDFLFVGDSIGRVHVVDIMHLEPTSARASSGVSVVTTFRAAADGITAILYLQELNFFVVSSFDASVALWKLEGSTACCIGVFGKSLWDANRVGHYCALPSPTERREQSLSSDSLHYLQALFEVPRVSAFPCDPAHAMKRLQANPLSPRKISSLSANSVDASPPLRLRLKVLPRSDQGANGSPGQSPRPSSVRDGRTTVALAAFLTECNEAGEPHTNATRQSRDEPRKATCEGQVQSARGSQYTQTAVGPRVTPSGADVLHSMALRLERMRPANQKPGAFTSKLVPAPPSASRGALTARRPSDRPSFSDRPASQLIIVQPLPISVSPHISLQPQPLSLLV